MFTYNKAFIIGVIFAFSVQLLPAVASAQYGGGGIIGGSMSVGYVAPAPAPASTGGNTSSGGKVLGASAYNFATNIRSGEKGTDVTELQKVLIAGGYLKISAPTGWFGPMTLAAVKAYQTANGITPVSGFVGPLTRAVLNRSTVSISNEKQGLASEVIGTVQNIWNKWEGTRTQ
jgi:peptidoglycan hydrolase-like protein with peptidoglycan-binding domain